MTSTHQFIKLKLLWRLQRNVNQSRYGVIPTSLKFYEWFDTGETHQLDESSSALNGTHKAQEAQRTSLSMEEVDKLIK